MHITDNGKPFFYLLFAMGIAIVPSIQYTVTPGAHAGKYSFDLKITIALPEFNDNFFQ